MRRTLIVTDNFYSNYEDVKSGNNETSYHDIVNDLSYSDGNHDFLLMDYIERFLGHKILNWSGNNSSSRNGAMVKIENNKVHTSPDIKDWVGFLILSDNIESINLVRTPESKNSDTQLAEKNFGYWKSYEKIEARENRLIMFTGNSYFTFSLTNDQPAYVQIFIFDCNWSRSLAPDYWLLREWQKKWYKKPLIDPILCDTIIKQAEEWAEEKGWTKKRHALYPTTDIPLKELKSSEIVTEIIKNFTFPYLAKKFHFDTDLMELNDLFVVKYAHDDQHKLDPHRDISMLSFNVLLNDATDFEGGGTYFHHSNEIVTNDKGSIVLHSGKFYHEGKAVTKGTRYILVGFVTINDSRINNDIIEQSRTRTISDEEMIRNLFLY